MKITKSQLKQIIKEELNEIWAGNVPTRGFGAPRAMSASAEELEAQTKAREKAKKAYRDYMSTPLSGLKTIDPGDPIRKTQVEDPAGPSGKVAEYLK